MRGKMLIGGDLVESRIQRQWLESINPANEAERSAMCRRASAADVNKAVTAAEGARHSAWAAMEPKDRSKLDEEARPAKLREKADEILRIEVVDTGNTISKMRADVASAGDTLDFYSPAATARSKARPFLASARNLHSTIREPYGRGRTASSRSTIRSVCCQCAGRAADGWQHRGPQAAGKSPSCLGHHAGRDRAAKCCRPAWSIS